MGLVNFNTIKKSNELCISLEDAKLQCDVDLDYEDERDVFILKCIRKAQSIIEKNPLIPFSFFTSTIEAYFENSMRLTLPKNPVKNVLKVEFYNEEKWQEIENYDLEIGDNYSYVNLTQRYKRIKVQFIAGEEKAEYIRDDLTESVARLTAYMIDNKNIKTEKQLYDDVVFQATLRNLKRL